MLAFTFHTENNFIYLSNQNNCYDVLVYQVLFQKVNTTKTLYEVFL